MTRHTYTLQQIKKGSETGIYFEENPGEKQLKGTIYTYHLLNIGWPYAVVLF